MLQDVTEDDIIETFGVNDNEFIGECRVLFIFFSSPYSLYVWILTLPIFAGISVCTQYNLTVEKLYFKWDAYVFNLPGEHNDTIIPTRDHLQQLKKDVQREFEKQRTRANKATRRTNKGKAALKKWNDHILLATDNDSVDDLYVPCTVSNFHVCIISTHYIYPLHCKIVYKVQQNEKG